MFIAGHAARLLVVSVGFISAFMPWYVFGNIGGAYSISLFDALKVTDNVGLELASLLFFLGLAASAMKPRA